MKLRKAVDKFMRGYFSAHGREKKTEAAYRADLVQFRDYVDAGAGLSEVSGVAIGRWVEYLEEEGYSPATVRRKTATLRMFCAYWVREGELSESPFWRIESSFGEISPPSPVISIKQMRALRVQAKRNVIAVKKDEVKRSSRGRNRLMMPRKFLALRDLALVELFCASGLKIGEVRMLDLSDWSGRQGALKVSGQRSVCERTVLLLSDDAIGAMREYVKMRREVVVGDAAALFINAKGNRLGVQGMANIIDQLSLGAGLRNTVTASVIRSSVEKYLLDNRVDLRVVMKYLGKTTVPVGSGVAHLTGDHVIGELRKVRPSLGF